MKSTQKCAECGKPICSGDCEGLCASCERRAAKRPRAHYTFNLVPKWAKLAKEDKKWLRSFGIKW